MSSSKVFRLGRAGPGQVGSHQKWNFWIKISIFLFFIHLMSTINIDRDMPLQKKTDTCHQKNLRPHLAPLGFGRNDLDYSLI